MCNIVQIIIEFVHNIHTIVYTDVPQKYNPTLCINNFKVLNESKYDFQL